MPSCFHSVSRSCVAVSRSSTDIGPWQRRQRQSAGSRGRVADVYSAIGGRRSRQSGSKLLGQFRQGSVTWTSCLSWRSEKARWWSGGRSYAVTRRGKTRCLCSVQAEGMLLRGATFVRQPPRLCCRCLTIIWWRPGESEYSVVLKIRKLRKNRNAKTARNGKIALNWNVSGT